jgi:hypothetical protein
MVQRVNGETNGILKIIEHIPYSIAAKQVSYSEVKIAARIIDKDNIFLKSTITINEREKNILIHITYDSQMGLYAGLDPNTNIEVKGNVFWDGSQYYIIGNLQEITTAKIYKIWIEWN